MGARSRRLPRARRAARGAGAADERDPQVEAGAQERVGARQVTGSGSRALLLARLLPFVSFDLISYGAGLTTTPLWRFLLATGIGQLPATLLYSYLGENLTGSARVLFWIFSVTTVLLVAGWSLGPVVLRRLRVARPVTAPAAAAGAGEE